MRHIFLILATFLYTAQVSALPVGNPAEATFFFFDNRCRACDCSPDCSSLEEFNFNVGYYGDYVFNRRLKTVDGKHIDYTHITTNAAYLGVTCWELFEIFATFGASKFSLNTSLVAFNSGNRSPKFDFETATSFSWSVGARATLWRYRCFFLGVEGQYFTSRPHTHVWFLPNLSANDNDHHSRYSEWQAGLGLAYRYSCYFVPYAAVKWSRALWEFNNQGLFLGNGGGPIATLVNLRSNQHWGYAIGLTLAPPFDCGNLAVTVEGRFGDEQACHVKAQLFF